MTLLELLELKAEPFWRLSNLTGQLLVRLETSLPEMTDIIGMLKELRREADRLGARSAVAQTDRIKDFLLSDRWGNNLVVLGTTLRDLVRDLHYRMIDDLENQFFLSVPSDNIDYYKRNIPLFDHKVEARFPSMSEEHIGSGEMLGIGETHRIGVSPDASSGTRGTGIWNHGRRDACIRIKLAGNSRSDQ